MIDTNEKNIIIGADGIDYDITPYKNPEDIAGYLGFIDQEGNFYRVRKITDPEYERPHDSWAKNFLAHYNIEKGQNLTNSTTLIKTYGFLLSSYRCDWYKEERTYITAERVGICNEEACETSLHNQKQLDTVRKIREYESSLANKRHR